MKIRHARAEDANAISALIQSVAHLFTLHPEGKGAEDFLQSIQPPAIASYIQSANFLYIVGFIDRELAGVVAIRDKTHLYHLFVAAEFQGRGLARQLWQHAKEEAVFAGNVRRFTVNSTPNAVPVYERFGFRATGPQVETKGLASIPMEMNLEEKTDG